MKAEDGLSAKGRLLWAKGRLLLPDSVGLRFEVDPSGHSGGGGRGLLGSERLCWGGEWGQAGASCHQFMSSYPGAVVLCGRFFWSPPHRSPDVTSPSPVWAGWGRSGTGVGWLGQAPAPAPQALKPHSSLEPHSHLWAPDLPWRGTPPLQDVPELPLRRPVQTRQRWGLGWCLQFFLPCPSSSR